MYPVAPSENIILQDDLVAITGHECITVDEAKQFIRQGGSSTILEENELELFIRAVRAQAERYLNLSLIQQQRRIIYQQYQFTEELPYGPHESVDSVVRTTDGVEETLTLTTDYQVFGHTYKSVRFPILWSTSSWRKHVTLSINYSGGYTPDTVPDGLKLAMLKAIATEYRYRENQSEKNVYLLSNNSRAWLEEYRRVKPSW